MAFDGIYRLQNPPLEGDIVLKAQNKAIAAFGSYAKPLGVVANGKYDAPTAAFIKEYQARKEASGYRPFLPANPNAKRGDMDAETKKALGILPMPPAPASAKYVGLAVPGTWGFWNLGPQIMAINRIPNRVFVQGVFYNTNAFIAPDPMHSYVEARTEGVAEMLRLALPDFRPKFPAGYSMGADVVTRFLYEWPAERRHEIVGVFKFGDPGHYPGMGIVGANSAHGGISQVWTPEWALDRTYSYQVSGDMYGDAAGYLPFMYDILTRAEFSVEFIKYMFTLLTGIPLDLGSIFTGVTAKPSPAGAGLLGLGGNSGMAGFGALSGILGLITPGLPSITTGPISLLAMLADIPGIVTTLIAALKFMFTGAHGHYWGDQYRLFEGLCAEDHAAMMVSRLAV